MALIRHGHSYFDTRYSWPEGFRTYAMAEAHAFVKRLGIWKYKKTRRRYLLRLRKEGKTVYSARNPYFMTRIQKADEIDLFEFEGRFVGVQGKLKKIQKLGNGAKLFYLEHQQLKKGLPVFNSEKIRRRQEQEMDKIKKGDHL